jgi:VWFA-related protein
MGLNEIQSAKNQKKILVMITDGFDTRSKTTPVEAEELLRRFEVLAYAIGMDEDPAVRKGRRFATYYYMLNKLTSAAGGRVIRLKAGEDSSVRSMADLLLEELHQQYTLGYYTKAESGSTGWRNIELRVSRPGAQARYRTGYYMRARSAN